VQDPKIVDLFAGPGGLDVAARWLGVPAIGIEWDANACDTRDAAGLRTERGDVRDFAPSQFAADVLAGGPPCQTFTVAGSGVGRRALEEVLQLIKRMGAGEDVRSDLEGALDERTGLVLQPLRWALSAHRAGKPYSAIVWEQVPAVLPVWEAMRGVLEDHDYVADHGILRTEEFGVAQTRRRAVLIARLKQDFVDMGEPPALKLPAPTHRPYRRGVLQDAAGGPDRRPWVSMGQVLSRRKPFEVVSNYGTGGDPKARGRRGSHEPAFTVTGKISRNRVISPGCENDRFTKGEAGQLQSFPADYPWRGRDIAQQIGNAVPPVLAVHILVAALGLGAETRDRALARAALSGATVSAADGASRRQDEAVDGLFAVHHGAPAPVESAGSPSRP
jgi:DNA (cytosine-5)-methyltransferase 1